MTGHPDSIRAGVVAALYSRDRSAFPRETFLTSPGLGTVSGCRALVLVGGVPVSGLGILGRRRDCPSRMEQCCCSPGL